MMNRHKCEVYRSVDWKDEPVWLSQCQLQECWKRRNPAVSKTWEDALFSAIYHRIMN